VTPQERTAIAGPPG